LLLEKSVILTTNLFPARGRLPKREEGRTLNKNKEKCLQDISVSLILNNKNKNSTNANCKLR
jgi:hypothetical protein